MSNMAPPAVAVVGAGLAGLSTAIFLAKAGVRVDLYEQNQSLEAQAVGVLTQMAYLKAGVDLAPLLRRIGQRVSTYRILRGSGAEVSNEPVDAAAQHYG
jgi:flavin-dependent dehydrogenase